MKTAKFGVKQEAILRLNIHNDEFNNFFCLNDSNFIKKYMLIKKKQRAQINGYGQLIKEPTVGDRKIQEIKNNLEFLSGLPNFKSRHLLNK